MDWPEISSNVKVVGPVLLGVTGVLAYLGITGLKCDLPDELFFGGMHERKRLLIEGEIQLRNWAPWAITVDRLAIRIKPESQRSDRRTRPLTGCGP
jgi:hypothetical protein